ncbi:MAG: serine O-acetyltransferase [Deltaproteobacteria bacterium]|nr:MAG: serine O-acetyltransferase [Deltaproteobacteria bacterium]
MAPPARIFSFRDWKANRDQGEEERPRVRLSPPTEGDPGLLGFVRQVSEDVQAVLDHDPAARHALEVVLVYPGLHALWMHRVANLMWRRRLVLAPRMVAHLNRFLTGVEIHPGARLGRRVFIDHGMGVVIGETAVVGDDCLLYQGVVLGGTSLAPTRRHPTLGRGVVVGTNACVLGAIHIGDGARVGSNSVVIRDVPEGTTVVGVPGKAVKTGRPSLEAQLDHANLPDPIAQLVGSLVREVEGLRDEVKRLSSRLEQAGGSDEG